MHGANFGARGHEESRVNRAHSRTVENPAPAGFLLVGGKAFTYLQYIAAPLRVGLVQPLVPMKFFLVLPVLLFVVACNSQPTRTVAASSDTSKAVCDAMVGEDWSHADPPEVSRELLAMAGFPKPPESILWYSSRPGSYMACVPLKSNHACSYTAHAFNQLPEHGGKNWSYLSGSVKQQGCVQQSQAGT